MIYFLMVQTLLLHSNVISLNISCKSFFKEFEKSEKYKRKIKNYFKKSNIDCIKLL